MQKKYVVALVVVLILGAVDVSVYSVRSEQGTGALIVRPDLSPPKVVLKPNCNINASQVIFDSQAQPASDFDSLFNAINNPLNGCDFKFFGYSPISGGGASSIRCSADEVKAIQYPPSRMKFVRCEKGNVAIDISYDPDPVNHPDQIVGDMSVKYPDSRATIRVPFTEISVQKEPR